MTKKTYVELAKVFAALLERPTTHREREMLQHVALRLACILKDDNPNFVRSKFIHACGIK